MRRLPVQFSNVLILTVIGSPEIAIGSKTKEGNTVNEELEQLMRRALETGLHMRRAQKEYFADKGRSKEKLIAAKRLEASFDMQLATLGFKSEQP